MIHEKPGAGLVSMVFVCVCVFAKFMVTPKLFTCKRVLHGAMAMP